VNRPRIVVLDDYEDSLRKTADWSKVEARADVVFHTERLRGDALLAAIRDAPKSVRWRTRARVGERMQWWQDVDDREAVY